MAPSRGGLHLSRHLSNNKTTAVMLNSKHRMLFHCMLQHSLGVLAALLHFCMPLNCKPVGHAMPISHAKKLFMYNSRGQVMPGCMF